MTLSTSKPEWLEDAIFYQIYPQSFYDSNGDGIGDIPGIIEKLDYIQSLGVTACWLNPCFASPFQDAGYDVADYYRVAERYGTNDDLRQLFEAARQRGIRILLDLVPGHTSIQHPWFIESCKPDRNPYTDYYIWTDAHWKWEIPGYRVISGYSQREGTYLTNFFYSQPALNYGFANPDPAQPWQQPVDAPGPKAVRKELKQIIRYWLEMGASGFRVDMAFSLIKADPTGMATSQLWLEIRHWLDEEFPEACLLSEWGVPSRAIPAGFHMDFCIPFGMPGYTSLLRKPYGPGPGTDPYAFSFFDRSGHGNVMEFLDDYLKHYQAVKGLGHIALPSGNHDINPRLRKGRTFQDLKLVFLFLLTMPGVPFIWYGDEIGMRSIDKLTSKEGGYTRTGARTPMQWNDRMNAGFSTADPSRIYLPIDPSSDRPTIQNQHEDPDSLLNQIRNLSTIRKSNPALQASGDFSILFAEAGQCPLVYQRSNNDSLFIIIVNPAGEPVDISIPAIQPGIPSTLYGEKDVFNLEMDSWRIRMPGASGGIYRI